MLCRGTSLAGTLPPLSPIGGRSVSPPLGRCERPAGLSRYSARGSLCSPWNGSLRAARSALPPRGAVVDLGPGRGRLVVAVGWRAGAPCDVAPARAAPARGPSALPSPPGGCAPGSLAAVPRGGLPRRPGAGKPALCGRWAAGVRWCCRGRPLVDIVENFADPYCAWQKGTNENSNGLLREFYPKGRNLSRVAPATLKRNLALINARPRKVLGFRSAQSLWDFELANCCT